MLRPGLTTLVTFPAAGGTGFLLNQLGHVSPPKYSYTIPGGCAQLSATLYRPARWRHEAIRPGRRLEAHRGGSVVWSGILDEPQPSDTGWSLSAHGAGGDAAAYRAIYTAPWATTSPDDVVNQAITRGLDWINPGIGNPSGMWIGQAPDSASTTVADVLSLICHKGGLTWQVQTIPQGNVLSVFALPTAATRLLVATGAVPQSITDGADVIYVRYQSSWDTGKTPAQYATTSVSNSDLITLTGRREDFADVSSAGKMLSTDAQAVGNQVLKKFTRAAFTDSFTARPGDLLNLGGQPVDPGAFYGDGLNAVVCKLLLADFAYGGEITHGTVQFLVGQYEWDDETLTAAITPFESIRHDFSTLLSSVVDTVPVRVHATSHPLRRVKPIKHRKRFHRHA